MHGSSYDTMVSLLLKYATNITGKVLDVGSYDINGSYKYIFGSGYDYQGLDIIPGPNVDIVTKDPYKWPIKDNTYDIIISGQCLEHVEAPWLWIEEIYRVCKPEGLTIIIAPWASGEHKHPKDCWRILPDGMHYLLNQKFKVLEVGKNKADKNYVGDCWGVGLKSKW